MATRITSLQCVAATSHETGRCGKACVEGTSLCTEHLENARAIFNDAFSNPNENPELQAKLAQLIASLDASGRDPGPALKGALSILQPGREKSVHPLELSARSRASLLASILRSDEALRVLESVTSSSKIGS